MTAAPGLDGGGNCFARGFDTWFMSSQHTTNVKMSKLEFHVAWGSGAGNGKWFTVVVTKTNQGPATPRYGRRQDHRRECIGGRCFCRC
jgi:hypothetical protein